MIENAILTVIIPAFNEQEGIGQTIMDLLPKAKVNKWEIIVINDGSTDNTLIELNKFGDEIKVISHVYNKGYGASLKTGITNSTTPLIAMYDADGQHKPSDLEMLFSNMESFDMVIGARGKTSHQDWVRKPGKWVLVKVANLLTGRKIPDLNSGLRVIKRDIITRMLSLFPDGFSFSTTSTIAFMNMGYNVNYYPIQVSKRIGNSTVKQFKHGSNTILLMLRLIVLFNPLKVFLPISIYLFLVAVVYEIVFGIIYLLPDNFRLIPAAFFMMLTSILIFFFGLVVDQISELRKQMLRDKI